MSALLVSCFGQRSFPSERELRKAVEEMSTAITGQAFARGDPLPDDPQGRLSEIAALLRAAVAERERLP